MKISSFLPLAAVGLKTILFKKSDPILGTIIVTDRCNLHCKHCSVNNITSVLYPYTQIRREMEQLYSMGIRILFFCGGETFLWRDGDITLRDLVIEAKRMGFLIVNVVTNGTFPLDLPEADLILLSLDGPGLVTTPSGETPMTSSWKTSKTLPLATSAFTWPSTRSIRTPSAMCAGPPGIRKMCGPFPLISIPPIPTPGSCPCPGRKRPPAAASSRK